MCRRQGKNTKIIVAFLSQKRSYHLNVHSTSSCEQERQPVKLQHGREEEDGRRHMCHMSEKIMRKSTLILASWPFTNLEFQVESPAVSPGLMLRARKSHGVRISKNPTIYSLEMKK